MFSKEETAAGISAFWTAFGRYMQPVPGADGAPRKWLNYETGVPGLYLRVFLQKRIAYAGIEIADTDSESGARLVDTLVETLPLLRRATGSEWDWISVASRPRQSLFWGTALQGKNPVLQSHWPEIIAFFKEALVAMDHYWTNAGPAFE